MKDLVFLFADFCLILLYYGYEQYYVDRGVDMTQEQYYKLARPQVESVANQFGIDFTEEEYEHILADAYMMTSAGSAMYKTDITKDKPLHTEVLRSCILSEYKKTHKVPVLSMRVNAIAGTFLLLNYMDLVAPYCPAGNLNLVMALITSLMITYRLCKNHNSFMDEIIPYRERIKRWKNMQLEL